MAKFCCKDSIILLDEQDMKKYPESLINLIWKWHLLNNKEQTPCKIFDITENNLEALKEFFDKGYWTNIWDIKNKNRYDLVIDGISCKIWDYFMLPFETDDEYEDSYEEIDFEIEEEDDFVLVEDEESDDEDY